MSVDPPTNRPVAKNLQIVEKLSADLHLLDGTLCVVTMIV
jgi:hypothetical protein